MQKLAKRLVAAVALVTMLVGTGAAAAQADSDQDAGLYFKGDTSWSW